MSDLNCALGISQLKKINFFVKERNKIIKFYKKKLEKYSEFIDNKNYSFDKDKILKSMFMALRKRQTNDEAIDRAVNGIVRQLESSGENEIQSKFIGELVMNALAEIDNVAYIRYASVYRNFREEKDFVQFVDKIDVFKKDKHYLNLALNLAKIWKV